MGALAKQLLRTALPVAVRLVFLFYPLVTNTAFEAFSCYEFGGHDTGNGTNAATRGWLVADVAIECGTPEHAHAKSQAYLAIAICA